MTRAAVSGVGAILALIAGFLLLAQKPDYRTARAKRLGFQHNVVISVEQPLAAIPSSGSRAPKPVLAR